MQKVAAAILGGVLALGICAAGCGAPTTRVEELRRYGLDSLDGIVSVSDVEFDKEVSFDGGGSLRVTVSGPRVINLFETGDIDVEDARLNYEAKVKTKGVKGKVYLEMWCSFKDRGEYFSRGLRSPMTGTINWATQQTPFFLKKGDNPDNIKLNLVVEGSGTVWIDDVKLIKGPLK